MALLGDGIIFRTGANTFPTYANNFSYSTSSSLITGLVYSINTFYAQPNFKFIRKL